MVLIVVVAIVQMVCNHSLRIKKKKNSAAMLVNGTQKYKVIEAKKKLIRNLLFSSTSVTPGENDIL